MDVLRHTGRAQLSSFVGGAPSNRAMDRAQWQLAPYTEADLQRQIDSADELYGARGRAGRRRRQRVRRRASTQYIAEAQLDPTQDAGRVRGASAVAADVEGAPT